METLIEGDSIGEVDGTEVVDMEEVLGEEVEEEVILSSLVMAIRERMVIKKKRVVRGMTKTQGRSIMK